jgi:hypothetical protein
MQAVAQVRESTQVLMLSKKQWFEPRPMGWLWFGGVCWSLSVSSLLLLSGKRIKDREHGRWPVYGVLIFKWPQTKLEY